MKLESRESIRKRWSSFNKGKHKVIKWLHIRGVIDHQTGFAKWNEYNKFYGLWLPAIATKIICIKCWHYEAQKTLQHILVATKFTLTMMSSFQKNPQRYLTGTSNHIELISKVADALSLSSKTHSRKIYSRFKFNHVFRSFPDIGQNLGSFQKLQLMKTSFVWILGFQKKNLNSIILYTYLNIHIHSLSSIALHQ